MSLALCDFAPQLRAGGALPVAPPFGAEPRAWPDAGASPCARCRAWRRGGGASPRAQPTVFLGPPHPLSALIHSQSARLSQTRWFQNRIVRCGHMSGTLGREARPLSVRMARVRPATQRLQPHFDRSIAQNHPVFPADPQPYWGAERDRFQRKRRLVL